jgi:cytochrome P450
VTNVVPSSMTLAIHAFRDLDLLSEIRQRLSSISQPGTLPKLDAKKIEKEPLLLSLYAETLRFGVQIHVPRNSPHREIAIGNTIIPRNKLILVNTWLAHTDESVWNTKNNTFPLTSFWPQRFLVDPDDPSSGPIKFNHREKIMDSNKRSQGVHYSTDGLEGAWIPFGGKLIIL